MRKKTIFLRVTECRYISYGNINVPGEFFGVLRTPVRRLPMWVGQSWPTRRRAFKEARQHIAYKGWKLLPSRGGRS